MYELPGLSAPVVLLVLPDPPLPAAQLDLAGRLVQLAQSAPARQLRQLRLAILVAPVARLVLPDLADQPNQLDCRPTGQMR